MSDVAEGTEPPVPSADTAGEHDNRLVALVFNVRFLRIVGQLLALLVLLGLGAYLVDNYQANVRDQAMRGGWNFLDQRTGFDIADADFRAGQPVSDALRIGVRNTAQSAVVGMVLATVIGVVVGIVRLSRSWVARQAATLYVEVLRNIPVLLIILFAGTGFRTLPQIQEASSFADVLVISNRGIGVPSPIAGDNLGIYAVALAIGLVIAAAVMYQRTQASLATGAPHHRILWGGGIVLVVAVIAYFAFDGPVTWSRPEAGENDVVGGAKLSIAYAALTGALALYHGSHIAEIVRGSIQAVPHGQTEAATAIGLSDFQRLRFVTLPQAFRIAVPPIINQLLSLTKNTSLGIAVSYFDIFALSYQLVGSSRAPSLQVMVILMAVYLMFSLVTSLLLNLVNRRLQLVER